MRLQLCFLCFGLLLVSSSLQCHGLLLPLTNTLSSLRPANDTATIHRLLRSSSLRSAARHRGRRHGTRRAPPPPPRHRQLSLPLAPGSDYTLSLSVGPPSTASSVSLFLDTGSDLVWFPCAPFTCMLCEGKATPGGNHSSPLPPPIDSRRISCASPLCSAAHSSAPTSDLCAAARCPLDAIETDSCASHACPPLYYAYGDGSLVANLRRGRVGLAASMAVENFTFACAHTALAEPVGVAGFGRGPLSLPAQLAPSLSGRFSYCLVAHSFRADRLIRSSPLILGRSTDAAAIGASETDFVYTPLLPNPKHPYFYSVALEAVSVGGKRIQAQPELGDVDRDGNGGMVVDSGTTFTMLPSDTFARVADEFARAMAAARFTRAEGAEAQTGLAPCYHYSPSDRAVPPVALHFRGNATVALPRRNYFMGFKSEEGRSVGCLMLMNVGGNNDDGEDGGGPAGTLGNFQQQGFEVVYDVDAGRVGFARRRCTDLWDTLSRR
uniref:Peptidase A1 domain-containing protein n=1 Tax=Oryza rufipogon TaxID=4529 RepID=A0A0E0PC15_ORYRU